MIYPSPYLAVDVIVLTKYHGSVLLIERRDDPFAGMFALPGGFTSPDETLLESAQRELSEETGLVGLDLKQFRTFGDPGRDPRGWIVTVVYYCILPGDLPSVKSGDDAKTARWFSLEKLPQLAFDHEKIIQEFYLPKRKQT